MSKNDDELNEFIDEVTDGAYSLPCVEVMVEMLLSAVPFGDVKHTGDTILRASKQLLAGYGVGQYECSLLLQAPRLCWLTLCSRVCT